MNKLKALSLAAGIFCVSLVQAVQIINNTSWIVIFGPAYTCQVPGCEVIHQPSLSIQPGEVNSVNGNSYKSLVTVIFPNGNYLQVDIGSTDKDDSVSFVEVDNNIIAYKENKEQVTKLKVEAHSRVF